MNWELTEIIDNNKGKNCFIEKKIQNQIKKNDGIQEIIEKSFCDWNLNNFYVKR